VFMGTTPQMILSAHMTEPPQPVTKHRDTVPAALESVVMRCLEKRPADRWQSAEELLPQLEALATPSGGVTPTDTRPMAGIASRRHWLVPTAALVAVFVLIVVVLSRMLASSPISITTSNIRAVTSEPGVEWQPALSPDGSQVAFVARRGDRQSVVIRSTVNIGAGEELILTQGPRDRLELFPAWSPDGEFVRFFNCPGVAVNPALREDCLWREVARLGGSIRPIDLPRHMTSSSWSPDDSRVAFIAARDSIFTYSIIDGTSALLAAPQGRGSQHSPTWSPDGKWIAYVDGNRPWLTSFNINESSIWMVGAHGGEPVRVTGDEHMDVSPAWLDDDHLLFISDRDGLREVYVVEVGPMGPHGDARKVPGVTDAHSISYSIAGAKLAFAKTTVHQNIWSYPIRPDPVSITDGHPVTNDNAVIEQHDVSPDGNWIAYDSDLRGNLDIYKRPLEGGSPMPITDSPLGEGGPQWSPDGTEIAFHSGVESGGTAVMVIAADGGTPIQLASSPGWDYNPRWSPSGLDVAFHSDRTGRSEVWIVSREAIGGSWSGANQLTNFGCYLFDWAPDGSGLLCRAGEEMVLVSRGGEVLWRYEPSTAGLVGFAYPKFSWDGSTILTYGAHEDGSIGIWAIPRQGGEPNLMVAYDDAEIAALRSLSVGPDHLYITVGEHESDIWVMDVEVGR